jgi:glyoxylase-like metal-dependent hydrolase (beta-lactamase superfamily II)
LKNLSERLTKKLSNDAKFVDSLSGATQGTNLKWDVFMTPGIPIVSDMPPGVKEVYFQAMASTLIYGMQEAVLVDAFMTLKQANDLADWIAASGKNLTTIYVTHGHGDHWFGIGTLLDRFPNARAVATPSVVKTMRQHASPEFLERFWKRAFPGQIPDKLVLAEELNEKFINLEGQDLVIPTPTTLPV